MTLRAESGPLFAPIEFHCTIQLDSHRTSAIKRRSTASYSYSHAFQTTWPVRLDCISSLDRLNAPQARGNLTNYLPRHRAYLAFQLPRPFIVRRSTFRPRTVEGVKTTVKRRFVSLHSQCFQLQKASEESRVKNRLKVSLHSFVLTTAYKLL